LAIKTGVPVQTVLLTLRIDRTIPAKISFRNLKIPNGAESLFEHYWFPAYETLFPVGWMEKCVITQQFGRTFLKAHSETGQRLL